MPRHETVMTTPGEWVELSQADVERVTLVNQSAMPLLITATADQTPPASTDGMRFMAGEGVLAVSLTELFPGVPDARRLWAYGENAQEVFISHA